MNNKPIYKGIKNLLLSNNQEKINTFFNYICAVFKTSVSFYPQEIQIEPSAACNLRCRMCTLNKSTNKNKFLTPNFLSKILKETKATSVNLTGMGETLLNPNFEELLKICYKNNVKTSFITNLQLLDSRHLQAIKKYPPNSIGVSMESGYFKKYNQIRLGANLKTTIKNLEKLNTFIYKNSLKTQININIVFLDFNLKKLNHIFKIIDLASQIKIPKITFQNINTLSPYIKNLYKKNIITKKFNEIKKYPHSKDIELIFPSTEISNHKCYYPWVYPQITASGELLPCCVIPQFGNYDDIVKKYSWGNVSTGTFKDSWNSQKAREFRHNYENLFPCKYCTKNKGIL